MAGSSQPPRRFFRGAFSPRFPPPPCPSYASIRSTCRKRDVVFDVDFILLLSSSRSLSLSFSLDLYASAFQLLLHTICFLVIVIVIKSIHSRRSQMSREEANCKDKLRTLMFRLLKLLYMFGRYKKNGFVIWKKRRNECMLE